MTDLLGRPIFWQNLRGAYAPILKEHEIHLWCLRLQLDEQDKQHAIDMLSDIQRNKYQRRQTAALKQSYLASRYYLLQLLGHYTRTPSNNIRLKYTRLNKPYLAAQKNTVEFNFTDTDCDEHSYGVYVFCKDMAVGVDCESLHRKSNFNTIAKRKFTANEQQFVYQADGSINAQRCLAMWTRKEAYGKATGQGINFAMNQLDLASPGSFELKFSDQNEQWRLQQLQLSEQLIACVVHQGHQELVIKAFNSTKHIP